MAYDPPRPHRPYLASPTSFDSLHAPPSITTWSDGSVSSFENPSAKIGGGGGGGGGSGLGSQHHQQGQQYSPHSPPLPSPPPAIAYQLPQRVSYSPGPTQGQRPASPAAMAAAGKRSPPPPPPPPMTGGPTGGRGGGVGSAPTTTRPTVLQKLGGGPSRNYSGQVGAGVAPGPPGPPRRGQQPPPGAVREKPDQYSVKMGGTGILETKESSNRKRKRVLLMSLAGTIVLAIIVLIVLGCKQML
ncbi:hypothetical protein JCM8202_005015 [Rhodotorula sphaerocarpa]